MQKESITKLLENFKKNKLSIDEVLTKLKTLPYEDIGFAKIDHHRALRKGFPEVVFCQGKTKEQIKEIFIRLAENNNNLILSRADEKTYNYLKRIDKRLRYNKYGRIITLEKKPLPKKGNLLILCAGTADIPVAEEAYVTAEILGNYVEKVYDVGVAGIHRILAYKEKLLKAKCIIVVAGMEGALASVVGGLSPSPIIAVPTSVGYGSHFNGLASLLAMLNSCAPGIVVVNIDNGFGAGYFASLVNV